MLLPHQVLPFLEHETPSVWEHAARYFHRAHDPAPATAEDFWRAIDRFGMESSLHLVTHLSDMPQTGRSLRRTLDALREKPAELYDFHLQHAVAAVDYPLLLAHREELLAAEYLLPRVRAHLSDRLALAEAPADDLWGRLLRHSEEVNDRYAGEFDQEVSDRLIEALSRHGDDAAGRALDRLRGGPRDDWMEIFCVRLLGELRHAPAAEVLIERLLEDADVLRERVADALTRIGTADVVRRIEAFYPGKEWHVRLYTDDPLARIKRPESEAALLRLIGDEKDEDLAGNLAASLCELCTMDGLEVVRRIILEERYDPRMEELDETFLTTAAMVGYEPPEAAEWRERIAERESERNRSLPDLLERFDELFGNTRDRWRRGEPPYPPTPGRDDDMPEESLDRPGWKSDPLDKPMYPPPAATFRRESPKVGRNDPCPCGSGKKYKKCCLKGSEFAV